jgi:ABC-2 type transport system permease protein
MNAITISSREPVRQASQVSHTKTTPFQVVWMLAWREWVRFFRQPFRVIAALGQPILFWILFGTGMHSSFRGDAQSGDFMTYFLPGTVAMILLFTAIFATISIIEDRREGFLQSVLVAPTSRTSIALGKVFGGAAIAWVQALIFVAIAIATGSCIVGLPTLELIGFMLMAAIALTSLGVCFAWPMESTQGFHALMNMVLMPMWLLSGSFFPSPNLAGGEPFGQIALHWVMRCNPMTYIVAGMRHLMSGSSALNTTSQGTYWTPSLGTSVVVTLAFAILATLAASMVVRRNQKGELQ